MKRAKNTSQDGLATADQRDRQAVLWVFAKMFSIQSESLNVESFLLNHLAEQDLLRLLLGRLTLDPCWLMSAIVLRSRRPLQGQTDAILQALRAFCRGKQLVRPRVQLDVHSLCGATATCSSHAMPPMLVKSITETQDQLERRRALFVAHPGPGKIALTAAGRSEASLRESELAAIGLRYGLPDLAPLREAARSIGIQHNSIRYAISKGMLKSYTLAGGAPLVSIKACRSLWPDGSPGHGKHRNF